MVVEMAARSVISLEAALTFLVPAQHSSVRVELMAARNAVWLQIELSAVREVEGWRFEAYFLAVLISIFWVRFYHSGLQT